MKPIAFLTSMFSGPRGCVSLLMEGNYVNVINLQYKYYIESKVLRTVFILMIAVRDKSKLLIQDKFSFCLILSIETRCYHLFESFDVIHCPGKEVCYVTLTQQGKEVWAKGILRNYTKIRGKISVIDFNESCGKWLVLFSALFVCFVYSPPSVDSCAR